MAFLSVSEMISAGSLCTALYLLCLAIYRLYFHPLAKFPGPKIAAVTYWYETYHDVYLKGNYYNKIREMHQRYGMCHCSTDFSRS